MADFTVTEAWLRDHCNNGAPTRDQIECLGQTYPPPVGWMQILDGLPITHQQRERFEQALDRRRLKREARGMDMFG